MVRELNIEIIQGAVYDEVFVWVDANDDPIDLTGYEAKMQIRSGKNRFSSLLHSVDNFNIDADSGSVQPIIHANETRALDFKWAYYDLVLIPPEGSTKQVRLVQGRVFLNSEVTYFPTVKNSPTLYNDLKLTISGQSSVVTTTSSQPAQTVNESVAESLAQVLLLRGRSSVVTNDGFIASDWDNNNSSNTINSITAAWESQVETERWEVRISGNSWINVGLVTSYTFNNLIPGEYTIERRGYGTGGYSNTVTENFQTDDFIPNLDSESDPFEFQTAPA